MGRLILGEGFLNHFAIRLPVLDGLDDDFDQEKQLRQLAFAL